VKPLSPRHLTGSAACLMQRHKSDRGQLPQSGLAGSADESPSNPSPQDPRPLIEQTNRPSHLPKLRDRAVEKDFEG
jgi:hypothetical protein